MLVQNHPIVIPSDLPDVRVIVTLSAILASRILMHNDRTEVKIRFCIGSDELGSKNNPASGAFIP
jgi:hypothetical protein